MRSTYKYLILMAVLGLVFILGPLLAYGDDVVPMDFKLRKGIEVTDDEVKIKDGRSLTVGATGSISEETNTMTLDDGDGLPITLQEIRNATGGTDTTAIHDNQAGEINAVSQEGTALEDGDALIGEDAQNSYAKIKILLSELWTYISGKISATYPNLDTDSTDDFDGAWSNLTGTPTTLAGYGITDAQADLDVPSQAEAEAGTATTERVWTAQRISQAIAALAGGGTDDQTAAEVTAVDEFDNSNSTNVQDVLDDLDAAIAGGGSTLGDVAVTAPLTGATNDILPGTDGTKITIAMPAATNSADGYMTSAQVTALEAIDTVLERNAAFAGAVLSSAPGSPTNGQLAIADGDNWQPGSTDQGTDDWLCIYRSSDTTWVGVYNITDGTLIASNAVLTGDLGTGVQTALGIEAGTSGGFAMHDDLPTAATRDSLGLDTDDTPQFAGIEVGNASDTTVTRSAAGVIAVEGTDLVRASSDINNAGVIQANAVDASMINDWYAYDEIPVAWMQDGTSAPAALDDASTRSPFVYRDFDDEADEDLNFVWFVPADLSGSTIQYRVKYLITNATGPSATEGVAFGLSGVSAGNNDATNGTKGTVVVVTDDTLNAAQHDVMVTGWSGDVTVTSLAAGEVAEMALIRDVSDTVDDYAQDVGVLSVEIRYVQNVAR